MKIKDVRRVQQDPSPQGFSTLARFAFVPAEGVVVFDCSLVTAPDGRLLVYGPPAKKGAQILSMAPEVRREVISMMLREVGIDDQYSRTGH